MASAFKAECQKKMVGGRKCAIRSFRVISTCGLSSTVNTQTGRTRLPPRLGLLPAPQAQDPEGPAGAPVVGGGGQPRTWGGAGACGKLPFPREAPSSRLCQLYGEEILTL